MLLSECSRVAPFVSKKYGRLQRVLIKAVGVVADPRDILCPRTSLDVDVLSDKTQRIACPIESPDRSVVQTPAVSGESAIVRQRIDDPPLIPLF